MVGIGGLEPRPMNVTIRDAGRALLGVGVAVRVGVGVASLWSSSAGVCKVVVVGVETMLRELFWRLKTGRNQSAMLPMRSK